MSGAGMVGRLEHMFDDGVRRWADGLAAQAAAGCRVDAADQVDHGEVSSLEPQTSAELPTPPTQPPTSLTDVPSWIAALSRLDRSVDDAERIRQLRLLEQLKSAAAAAQAVVTADFVGLAARRAAGGRGGGRPGRVRASAPRWRWPASESPHRGSRLVGLAQALTAELPATLAALRAGETSEWRATIIARETACLDPADRRAADAELGPPTGQAR